MPSKHTVGRFFSNLLLGIFIVLGLAVLVPLLPIRNNLHVLTVLSGSMEPKIHTGSVVIIKPESQYNIGDVVSYSLAQTVQTENGTITHRIIKKVDVKGVTTYLTKGDANTAPDPVYITNGNIVGKEIGTIPRIGYFFQFIKQPLGFVLIIVIPCTLIIYEELRKTHKEVKRIVSERKTKKENATVVEEETPKPKKAKPRE